MTDLSFYVTMAKASKGRATAQVIFEALSSPNVFVFGELLDVPSVAELKGNTECGAAYELLKIFGHETYLSYHSRKGELGDLTKEQANKLKQLTIISLATRSRHLKYEDLMRELNVSDIRTLEDIVIEAITNDLIKGKLDQAARCMEVYDVIGRDVKKDDVDSMLAVLDKWHETSSLMISKLDDMMTDGKNVAVSARVCTLLTFFFFFF